ncbi:fungal-specific transcription factor domain-containing protein [Aspergillus ambiguus]|uniref:transcription factor domain-containing protein n=1 Tax=Aspergillus ambiguus TaxID=176160 RepID=UPI003CCCD8F2
MVRPARTFQCQRCPRTFARLEHLQRHDRSHTKEKPFQCEKCPKCFTRKDLLARHERLAHSSQSAAIGESSDSPSSPSHRVFDGLNMLASAITDGSSAAPPSTGHEMFTGSQPFTPDVTPTVSTTHNTAPHGQTGFTESFGTFGACSSYDDDFTSFLDSIPLPSHPYSPSYQPLPLFPAFNFDAQPVYDRSADTERVQHDMATPTSSVLPRHGTQLPSLQPEESHTPYKGRQPKSSLSVTTQCRDRLVASLLDYANVIRDPFIPSRHALSRCLTGYLTGFHDHYPFKHIPTLEVDCLPLHLFLSMAALGAQYCREPDTSLNLYYVARIVTMEHIRREFQWALHKSSVISDRTRDRIPESEDRDIMETVQALLLLTSVSGWFEHEPPYSEALYMRSFMETLLRKRGLNELPTQDGSWKSWIQSEEWKRTTLVVFCFFNIHTIVFDLPPMILTEDISLDLPCTEKEWQATSAEQWIAERSQSEVEPKVQDALCSLFTHGSGAKGRLESFSSMGGYVLIHAILQNIWLIQKTYRLPGLNRNILAAPEIISLEQALEHWCQCWEHNQEASIDPFNPHGPLSFTSTALLRLAYIRLNADFSSARRLQTWKPDQIAQSLNDNLSVERSDRLTRAALHCAHALSTPIKLGINFVAHTQVVSWSNQYALCSLECAVLLAKWLEVATLPNPEPPLTEQESKLLEFVIEMVMETQHGVSRDWLLANNTRLSAIVTRLWARLFTADYIWELVNLIGRSLKSYADILEMKN